MNIDICDWVDIVDLGVDVNEDTFNQAIAENPGAVVGLSALLTTTMVQMKNVLESLKEKGSKAKAIIGGAPVSDEYAREIGADAYCYDGMNAVDRVKSMLGVA